MSPAVRYEASPIASYEPMQAGLPASYKRFMLAMIRRAAEEAAKGSREAVEWLLGDDAAWYLESLGLDKKALHDWIDSGMKLPHKGGNPVGGAGNKGIQHRRNGRNPVTYTGTQTSFLEALEMTEQPQPAEKTGMIDDAVASAMRELEMSDEEMEVFSETLYQGLNQVIGQARQAVTSRRHKSGQDNLMTQYQAELAKVRGDPWQVTKVQQKYRQAGLRI